MVKAEGTLLLAGSLKLNFDPYSLGSPDRCN